MKVLIEYANSAKKLNLEEDANMDAIMKSIQRIFNLDGGSKLKLQIFDKEFGAFSDLEHEGEIENLSRIRVLVIPEKSQETTAAECPSTSTHPMSNLRLANWNSDSFKIDESSFSFISREELKQASSVHKDSNILHKASYTLKKEVLDIMSKELCRYSLYPTKDMFNDATSILLTAFPFLRDPVGDGTACWNIFLKYRMQEIRRKSKASEAKDNIGLIPRGIEPAGNTKVKCSPETPLRNTGFKKPRKGEINYNPEMPDGETVDTLELHKEVLKNECFKEKFEVAERMAITFVLRRQEILKGTSIGIFKEQWPALFAKEMLRQEMIRVVGFDIFPKVQANVKNEALLKVARKVSKTVVSDEDVLKSLKKIFKEKWFFYIEMVDPKDSTCLFTEDENAEVEECVLPPHPIIVQTASEFAIMGENVILLEVEDLLTAVICLICIYYVLDLNYNEQGHKCMLFLQVCLADIQSSRKLPIKVRSILSNMKLSEQHKI